MFDLFVVILKIKLLQLFPSWVYKFILPTVQQDLLFIFTWRPLSAVFAHLDGRTAQVWNSTVWLWRALACWLQMLSFFLLSLDSVYIHPLSCLLTLFWWHLLCDPLGLTKAALLGMGFKLSTRTWGIHHCPYYEWQWLPLPLKSIKAGSSADQREIHDPFLHLWLNV